MDVSENSGTPKSSILIGFSIINHPFWGTTIFGNTHMCNLMSCQLLKLPDAEFETGCCEARFTNLLATLSQKGGTIFTKERQSFW